MSKMFENKYISSIIKFILTILYIAKYSIDNFVLYINIYLK